MTTTSEKNDCATTACATERGAGRRKSTVRPPRTPWMTTDITAATPRYLTHARRSTLQSQTERITVSSPTNAATRRCVCSYTTPPFIGGISCPKESGQSGTDIPDPVLVTRPPATTSRNVAHAVKTANLCTVIPAISHPHCL